MNEIFIRTQDLPQWLVDKYFSHADLYSIDELIALIENLDADLESLQEKYDDFKQEVEENYRYTPQT